MNHYKLTNYFKENIYKLKEHFGFRAFVTTLFSLFLVVANSYLFFASAIYGFSNYDIFPLIILFFFGSIGYICSCFAIIVITFSFANSSQHNSSVKGSSWFSEAFKGKNAKEIIAAIFVLLFMLGGAFGGIGYYIAKDVQFKNMPSTTAKVNDLIYNGDGYSVEYKYSVDGITYYSKGKGSTSGSALPAEIGEEVIIKYDPQNPNNVFIKNEYRFFLAFGLFFLYFFGVILIYDIYERGYLKLQFFLAFIMLGLSALVVFAITSTPQPKGIIAFVGKNQFLHIVFLFSNIGLMELFNGLIWFDGKKLKEQRAKIKMQHEKEKVKIKLQEEKEKRLKITKAEQNKYLEIARQKQRKLLESNNKKIDKM